MNINIFCKMSLICCLLIPLAQVQAAVVIKEKSGTDTKVSAKLQALGLNKSSDVVIKKENCGSEYTFLSKYKLENDAKNLGLDCSAQKHINEELGIIFKSTSPEERGKLRFVLMAGVANSRALGINSLGTSTGVGMQYENKSGYDLTITLTQLQDFNPETIDKSRIRFWHEANMVLTKDLDFSGTLIPRMKWLTTKALIKGSAVENTFEGQEFNFKFKAGLRFIYSPTNKINVKLDGGIAAIYFEIDDDHAREVSYFTAADGTLRNRGRSDLDTMGLGVFLDPSITVVINDKLNVGALFGFLFDKDGTLLESNAGVFLNYQLFKFEDGSAITFRLSERYQGFSDAYLGKFNLNTNDNWPRPVTDVEEDFRTDAQINYSF